MKCKNCKNDLFKIEYINTCEDCKNNGAYNEYENHDLEYDEEIILKLGLLREEVENDGQCKIGDAFGGGCYLIACTKCGYIINIPCYED